MNPDFRGDSDHHDGTSDATPGGYVEQRRPGELGFALFLTAASLFLLYSAYGISEFEALSAPGAVPMATTLVMAISAMVVAYRTARLKKVQSETLSGDILPGKVLLFIGFLIVFGLLLKPLGFVPTAALFLILAIKVLARKGWGYSFATAMSALFIIWIVFRVVFTVLLPAGIVPEAEFIQLFRNLVSSGAN
ncbi:tripartite tricarboxylate transporter TctB family protein [Puniceibacterium sp. IMCC21224]|uniref:tripartite tricarboxylate transporter TctB family protein n=1 Tax=Puniceibacterium sp. IMCC21224 TaxID=1618204 RepID=UPI00064D8D26|nr:tripartite tricarboxylate transporter TctB family protein [Puniceibacterium sp. IMCC21224]KMK65059.1 Tripartite tricarboxylate transporter TctB family [Puniceibacterium sp. IMCC21224]